jgi:Leucine-rich repeat (LRR) protein
MGKKLLQLIIFAVLFSGIANPLSLPGEEQVENFQKKRNLSGPIPISNPKNKGSEEHDPGKTGIIVRPIQLPEKLPLTLGTMAWLVNEYAKMCEPYGANPDHCNTYSYHVTNFNPLLLLKGIDQLTFFLQNNQKNENMINAAKKYNGIVRILEELNLFKSTINTHFQKDHEKKKLGMHPFAFLPYYLHAKLAEPDFAMKNLLQAMPRSKIKENYQHIYQDIKNGKLEVPGIFAYGLKQELPETVEFFLSSSESIEKKLEDLVAQYGKDKRVILKMENASCEMYSFFKALQKSSLRVTGLDLSNNCLGIDDISILADELTRNKFMTSLKLGGNNIDDGGAMVIAAALEKNTSLTSLDLSSNRISDKGAMVIAKVLEQNTSLIMLNLWDNNIGYEGMKVIAEVLEKNNSLTSLDLRNNNIDDEGATVIAKALEKKMSLTSLDLSGNRISDKGVKLILKVLEGNRSPTVVNLSYNDASNEKI